MSSVPLTRTHDGDASTVRALNCPNCGGTVALRAAGSSVSLVCEHCGSTLDATRPDLAVILRANEALHRPEIALGTRAALGGSTWEVTGYLERSDGEEGWAEYLLFNPYEGYAFLIDDGERFSLGRLLDHLPDYDNGRLVDGDERYEPTYDPYPARVTFVVGEFYWRVAVGEEATVTDYATPGAMLSCEENGQERSWTRSALLERGEAEAAFGIPARCAPGFGSTPRPHEPSPWLRRLREALVIGALAAAVLLFLGLSAPGRQTVLTRELQVPFDEQGHNAVIGPIELPAGRQSVHVRARAPSLDNAWLDLDYSLVERRSQESFDAYTTAERYHGRDSDGDWSEGDRTKNVQFSSIPRGTYDLVIDGAAHRWLDPKAPSPIFGIAEQPATTVPLTVEVERGGGTGGLLLLLLLLVAAWPGYLWLRHAAFEAQRRAWTRSDDEDEDDDDDNWNA